MLLKYLETHYSGWGVSDISFYYNKSVIFKMSNSSYDRLFEIGFPGLPRISPFA